MTDLISRDPALEKRLLDYILALNSSADGYWNERIAGTTWTRLEQIREWRERYRARRSVASLYNDAKNEPFSRASNLGMGVEQIFGERLLATTLANSVDLEPSVQAFEEGTAKVDDAITRYLDQYNRHEIAVREAYELLDREVFTIGTVFAKWTWGSLWKQREVPYYVWGDPQTKQPLQRLNPQTGAPELMPADPKMPEEAWPTNPIGQRLTPLKLSQIDLRLAKEGPQVAVRPIEAIGVPASAKTVDPEDWDWISDTYSVSPWWFLGREGDPFDGKLQNLEKLWRFLNINPNNLYLNPDGKKLTDPVDLIEWHGKFPMTATGKPIEVIALVAKKPKLLLAWRASPLPRRPFFNRQVWSRQGSPFGIGIPESLYAIRSTMDAQLNQDIDAGNLYNHPPILLSTLAILEDEDYEQTGPGTIWTMQDINGAKFLAPPVSKRDPIAMLNYLFGMAQRLWGVTDIFTGAPTPTLAPSLRTARGAMVVQSEGNIKFGHLVKKLEATRTKEEQLKYEMFGTMLTQPKKFEIDGQLGVIDKTFFRDGVLVRAVGDGLQTNPTLRQQVASELYTLYVNSKNPYILDPETLWDFTKYLNQTYGLRLDLKTPQALQQLQMIQQIAADPIGQQKLKEAIQLIQIRNAQQQAMSSIQPNNGAGNEATGGMVQRPVFQ